jgi:hypothetical protein
LIVSVGMSCDAGDTDGASAAHSILISVAPTAASVKTPGARRPVRPVSPPPAIATSGDERVPQGVQADLLGDPGLAGHPAHGPGGTVPIQPLPARETGNAACGSGHP